MLVDGELTGWLSRGDRQLLAWLPDDEPRRTHALRGMAAELARIAEEGAGRQGLLIADVNGRPVDAHPIAAFLAEAGFSRGALGMAREANRRTKG